MKKGQLKNLSATIIVLVIVAVLLGVGSGIIQDIREGEKTVDTIQVVNESFTSRNATNGGDTLNFLPIVSGSIQIINGSNNVVIGVANFSIGLTSGQINLTGFSYYNNTAMNASYRYTKDTESWFYNTTREGSEGIEEISTWQDTIGLIVIAVMIVGLVFGLMRAKLE